MILNNDVRTQDKVLWTNVTIRCWNWRHVALLLWFQFQFLGFSRERRFCIHDWLCANRWQPTWTPWSGIPLSWRRTLCRWSEWMSTLTWNRKWVLTKSFLTSTQQRERQKDFAMTRVRMSLERKALQTKPLVSHLAAHPRHCHPFVKANPHEGPPQRVSFFIAANPQHSVRNVVCWNDLDPDL